MSITPQQLAKIERKLAELERQERIHRQYEQLQQYEALIQATPPNTYTPEQLHTMNVRHDYSSMDWSDFDAVINGGLTTDEVQP